jgi:hypothetical protein
LLNYIAAFLTLASILGPRAMRAQDSGVLLGLHVTSGDSGASYRTYWIARESGAVRLIATGPDLLVPRRSGFWRVCLVSGHNLSEGQLNEWESLIARPATPARGQCTVRDESPTEAENEAASCNTTSRTEILFLGSDAASLEQHQESNCGAHYSGGTNVELASLDDSVSIDLFKLLEPSRREALLPATIKAAREEFADLGTVDTSEVEDLVEGAHFNVLHQWAVERGAGHWQTVGQAYCSPYVACGDGVRRFTVAGFAAPRALVGHDELSPSLASIKAVLPHVSDAVSSPRGDLLVAMNGDSVFVFAVNRGQLGEPVLRLPVSGRIVMAQWAVGRFVPIWTRDLTRLLGTKAPTPSDPR